MKLRSITSLVQQTTSIFRRFPAESLFAGCGTAAAIEYIALDLKGIRLSSLMERGIMAAMIGFLLSLSVSLYCESRAITGSRMLLFKAVAAIAGALSFYALQPEINPGDYTRFAVLLFALHLLVAVAPCLRKGHIQEFWEFNKTLFLRIQSSILYSLVLFAGIAAAMGAMHVLFDIRFRYHDFMYLWAMIAGLFNTLFFLAGIPENLHSPDAGLSYPKSLKIFTQYVLIPLATLYVVILLSYEIKILFSGSLPKGTVSSLILGYAVFGILSLLLVFPIRNQEENKWIKTFARYFYLLMIPLLVLLFIAAGTRVFSYGITPSRYFLMLLALWLTGITLYFLVSKKQNIKVIPVSLFLLSMLTVSGPQSFSEVSKYSQLQLLKKLYKHHGLLENGKLKPAKPLTFTVREGKTASGSHDYLFNNHEADVLLPYLDNKAVAMLDSVTKKASGNNLSRADRYSLNEDKKYILSKYLGLYSFSGYDGRQDIDATGGGEVITYYNFKSESSSLVDVSGYDYVLLEEQMSTHQDIYTSGNLRLQINNTADSVIMLRMNGSPLKFDVAKLAKALLLSNADSTGHNPHSSIADRTAVLPEKQLLISASSSLYLVEFRIASLSITFNEKRSLKGISQLSGHFLIKKK